MAPRPYPNGQGNALEMVESGIHGKPSPLSNRGRDAPGRDLLTRDCEHDPRWVGATARFLLSQKRKTREASESESDPLCRRFLQCDTMSLVVSGAVSSQPSIQGCLQSLSASLVTVEWKARGNV